MQLTLWYGRARWQFAAAAAALSVCAGAQAAPADQAANTTKPNIVFIISDDHRYDCMGISGNPNVKTPNLDRMAHEGQWFKNFTIQIPTCSASRSAILTGLPPYTNGWYSNEFQRKDVIDAHGFDRYHLLPKQMISNGYHTALVGKWHITPNPWLCGFETIRHWMEGGAGPYVDPKLSNGPVRNMQTVKGFTQEIFANDAVDELKKKADGETTQPLFLWVAFTAPHGPFGPNPKKFEEMYAGKSAEELAPPSFYDDPEKTHKGRQSWNNYYASISALDEQVGRIMDTIRNSSLSTNTLVIFMGDNGFMMGRRDMNGKYVPYEDSLRVPMITWGPDSLMKSKDTTVTASINSLDISPTFVKLAGGTPPEDWVGHSFVDVLADGNSHGFDHSISAYPDNMSMIAHVKAYRVIRTGDYKLILWHPDTNRPPELYDLRNDPAENTNIFNSLKVSDVQKRLEDILTRYRQETGDTEWDPKGPLGMFEPERLHWMAIDEGPDKKAGAKPGIAIKAEDGKSSAGKQANHPKKKRKGARKAR